MKYLGIDYGSKKIGLATSDEGGSFAFPHSIVQNDKVLAVAQQVVDICQKENIDNVVIGRSVDLDGRENRIEKDITVFILALKEIWTGNIYRFDERMTTSGAQALLRSTFVHSANSKHTARNAKMVREHTKDDDAKVAAYILQGYLDMHRRV